MSPLRLVKACAHWQKKSAWTKIPEGLRGIYALHKGSVSKDKFDVVYVGMASAGKGLKARIKRHAKNKWQGLLWTHFSLFAVWENIRKEEINELEALFREIYRKDDEANRLNVQRSSASLRNVRVANLSHFPRAFELKTGN